MQNYTISELKLRNSSERPVLKLSMKLIETYKFINKVYYKAEAQKCRDKEDHDRIHQIKILEEKHLEMKNVLSYNRKQLNIYREKLTILQANHERLQKLQQRENESRKCPICYENDIYYVIIPCGHTICEKCSDKWTRSDCPTCRTPIQSNMRLYLPGQY